MSTFKKYQDKVSEVLGHDDNLISNLYNTARRVQLEVVKNNKVAYTSLVKQELTKTWIGKYFSNDVIVENQIPYDPTIGMEIVMSATYETRKDAEQKQEAREKALDGFYKVSEQKPVAGQKAILTTESIMGNGQVMGTFKDIQGTLWFMPKGNRSRGYNWYTINDRYYKPLTTFK